MSKSTGQTVKASLPKPVSSGELQQNKTPAEGSEMIICRKRGLESLHHSINVVKAIIQNIRDLNLKFTDCLFKSLVEIQTTLKNSF